MVEQSAAIGDIARYADLICRLDGLEGERRLIEGEQIALSETVIPELREVGVMTLKTTGSVEVMLWAERDPEDGTYNVESRVLS
jgi:hypothetical protein